MKWYLLLGTMGLWMACSSGGGGGSSLSPSAPGGGSGRIALVVSGAKSFNPNSAPGHITQYAITVSGDGFSPLTSVVNGDATDATIEGIPAGEHRAVRIMAMNANGQSIREGDAQDVTVPSDTVAEVPIAMQAVPVITNVADGAYVTNTRLRFDIFSDPATVVEMSSNSGTTSVPLTDVVENRSTVATDASTGLASFVPPKLSPGDYTLTVRDTKTNRKSDVAIVVTDGTREKGAPLKSVVVRGAMVMRATD